MSYSDEDYELLSNPIPDNPCDSCSIQNCKFSQCTAKGKWEVATSKLRERNLLEVAELIRDYNNYATSIIDAKKFTDFQLQKLKEAGLDLDRLQLTQISDKLYSEDAVYADYFKKFYSGKIVKLCKKYNCSQNDLPKYLNQELKERDNR